VSKRFGSNLFWIFGLVCCLPLWSQTDRESYPTPYHDYQEVVSSLSDWAQKHSHATLLEIGESASGKSIHVLQIAAPGDTAATDRPGIFLGANIVGTHHSGTEAALHLITALLDEGNERASKSIQSKTYYIAPILNPDAHERFFANPSMQFSGNQGKLDRDRDGLYGEDGPNDLNGDGMLTQMRIADPEGRLIPDPDEPQIMRRADAKEGEQGTHKVVSEGQDDDGDGEFNEDPAVGINPAINFAHNFAFDNPSAGPWASAAPESKAIMDFLLGHPNIALAVVYGPANSFLSPPRGSGGSVDTGNLKLEIPKQIAEFLGLDPEQKYTIDEIWEVAKNIPQVKQNNFTKEDVAQFLGVGPATKPTGEDLEVLAHFAEKYKKRLEDAGLDQKRDGNQDPPGGFSSWLYYQYGALTVELDVWGVPKAPEPEKAEEEKDVLTIDKMEGMTTEEFVALGEDKINEFLKANKVPAQYSAKAVMNMMSSGQVTPKKVAGMMKQMGAGGAAKKKEGSRDDLLIFAREHAPWAVVPWTAVTLPDGTQAEVGGIDQYLRHNPPHALLEKALTAHTETVLELSENLAQVAIKDVKVTQLGKDVFRVKAVAGNDGFIPTHTGLAMKAKNRLPVRLGLGSGDQFSVLHGPKWVTSEGIKGNAVDLSGEWVVKANNKNAKINVILQSDHAGHASREVSLTEGGR